MSDKENTSAENRWYHNLVRWFDSSTPYRDELISRYGVEWLRVLPFALVHLACLGVFWDRFGRLRRPSRKLSERILKSFSQENVS